MYPPINSDHHAYYIAARQARAEAINAAIQGLVSLFRRPAKQDCDTTWSLAEAPRAR